jgi:hypothetical protein
MSIILTINESENERKRLLEEKKWIEREYNRLNNKNKLVDDIAKSKKAIINKVKEIDMIINNKELLIEEYNKRNEKLPEQSKIFSLSHFSEILIRERAKALEMIDQYNVLLEPQNYISMKSNFEHDLDLLSNIKLDGKIKNATFKSLIQLQEVFLDCFSVQIEKADNKKEIINLLYILRYYNFIPVSKNASIKDLKELRPKIMEIENLLINKMYGLKMVSKNMELDIIDNVFDTKIIDLENIEFEFKINDSDIELILYDEETIHEKIKIDINDIEDIQKIKFNKKIRLFN